MNWFRWPWVLLALLALPYLRARMRRPRPSAIAFPRLPAHFRSTPRERWYAFPNTLRLFALACLIFAAAGPTWDQRPTRQIANSIGIQILVDRSSSMSHDDMLYEGHNQSRLDVVKKLSDDFVRGRAADMIGLIGFAADPVTFCPLTLSHELLRPALTSIRVAEGEQDGTAIGDAVALAAARFKLAESNQFKSKVIILLTDGENNLGARTVAEAAALAKEWGVRIYTIAIRPSSDGEWAKEVADELETLSLETSGVSRVASDGSALRSIYAEIDKLERTDVGVVKRDGSGRVFISLVCAGIAMLAAEAMLRQTWLRSIP